MWADREARGFARALKRDALSGAAAGAHGGLPAAARAAALAAVFCRQLEASHLVSVTAAVGAELWPPVEAALRRHVRRARDALAMVAGE